MLIDMAGECGRGQIVVAAGARRSMHPKMQGSNRHLVVMRDFARRR
jgi:hypothetical protein